MRGKTRITEIESVDLFLQEEKHLSGPPPELEQLFFTDTADTRQLQFGQSRIGMASSPPDRSGLYFEITSSVAFP
jgi:hypothetical protein